ncbi:MAG: lysine-sensitive aspartokinase 3 [Acidobacteriia bacterium]|nr:lysine-sensitive aspartokinase 3 [Terriglobia bacterium]
MELNGPTVLKFGGTSVKDASAFRRVAEIVAARREAMPVVVVSAMSRMTDALLAGFQTAAAGDAAGAMAALDAQFQRHAAVKEDLLGKEAPAMERFLTEARDAVARLLQSAASGAAPAAELQDKVVSYGERMSSCLLAAVLRAQGLEAELVDARACIVTDEDYGRATPLMDQTEYRTRSRIEPLLAAGRIPVLGGFIGATEAGMTTTLGRGGSDYSAALIGAALDAREIQIWTDVSGVLTADPRVVPAARTIPRLSYAEAAELAYFGAKVLHPKTIHPAVAKGIPFLICNSHAPQEAGTLICSESEMSPGAVKSIAHKTGITTVLITSGRMLGAYGFLRALFEVFDRHLTVIDIVTTSEVSVSLSLDDDSALPEILRDLQPLGAVEVECHRAVICIVGEGLRATPGVAGRLFSTIADVNVSLISQGASRINLTFVTDEAVVNDVVCRLHQAFFESGPE